MRTLISKQSIATVGIERKHFPLRDGITTVKS